MSSYKKLAELTTAEAPLKAGVLEKALDGYEKEIAGLKEASEKVEGPKVEQFIDKFIDNTLKHQKLFGKLEKELPAETHQAIQKAKDGNMTNFSETVVALIPQEVLAEKLNKVMEEQKGSNYKNFKNLEVLQLVEEKVPEPAKEAIRKAQENALKRLQGDLEKMSLRDQEKFKDYIAGIGGNEVQHLGIIDTLGKEELPSVVRETLTQAREKVIEKATKRCPGLPDKKMRQRRSNSVPESSFTARTNQRVHPAND